MDDSVSSENFYIPLLEEDLDNESLHDTVINCLYILLRLRLIVLGGIVPHITVAETPYSTYIVTWDDRVTIKVLLLWDVDVVSRGNYAGSVDGDNTPIDLDLTWLSLLGGVDDLIRSRCNHSLNLPGLDGHRWYRWLLPDLIDLLSLIGGNH